MQRPPSHIPQPPGLFITGTDTDVGKTYVGAMIARTLAAAGWRVGVYKPVASGCVETPDGLVSGDALALWQAAGCPGELARVCPQRFRAPLAPHQSARREGVRVDRDLLREGLGYWRERSQVLIVEGAGGLLSPVTDAEYVADLALDLGFPLVVVTANSLGTIHRTLTTLMACATYRGGLNVAGVVLNATRPSAADESQGGNLEELRARCGVPVLAEVAWQASAFREAIDWMQLGTGGRPAAPHGKPIGEEQQGHAGPG